MADPKRGRPPIDADDRSVSVSVRVPSKQYDAICQQAKRDAVPVPDVLRQAIRKQIAK